MDIGFTEEQSLLRDSVKRYCSAKYEGRRKEMVRERLTLDSDNWDEFSNAGWLGVGVPEEFGGFGGSIIETAIISEEFGRASVIEPYVACGVTATQVICRLASDNQKRALLPPIVAAKHIYALAHGEENCHRPSALLQTTAKLEDPQNVILNGKKTLVLGGDQAEFFLVSAAGLGKDGTRDQINIFVVPVGAVGLRRRAFRTLDGRGAADIFLDSVKLSMESLLGSNENVMASIEFATDFGIAAYCAEAIGAMDKVITSTADYLKLRRAYGVTLSSFQALQHKFADMLVELEMSRSILLGVFSAFSGDDRRMQQRAVSAAKAQIATSGKLVAKHGIQLHGAMGMVDDYVIGQQFKRLTVFEGLLGSPEFHFDRYKSS